MKSILYLTNRTQEQYDDVVFDIWFKWCELNAQHFEDVYPEQGKIQFQQFLAHSKLNAWWCRELALLEDAFLKEANYYEGRIEPSTARSLWHHHVTKIMRLYPTVLIKNIRKSNTQKR